MSTRTQDESRRLHSGDYVLAYERKPMARVTRLVPAMRLTPSVKIADYACGNAMLLEAVNGLVNHYVGVDFSEDFISAAHARAERIRARNYEFHCQDIVEFCAQHPQEFDVATALDFSEHVLDEQFVDIFSAIRRSLKHNGRLYLHTPNLDFFLERMRDANFLLKQRPEHVAVRSISENVKLLKQIGFLPENIHVEVMSHYNILSILHPLRHLPMVGKYFEARIFIECIR